MVEQQKRQWWEYLTWRHYVLLGVFLFFLVLLISCGSDDEVANEPSLTIVVPVTISEEVVERPPPSASMSNLTDNGLIPTVKLMNILVLLGVILMVLTTIVSIFQRVM